jgi:hypothetical protein
VHGNAVLFHSNHNRTDLGYPSQTHLGKQSDPLLHWTNEL